MTVDQLTERLQRLDDLIHRSQSQRDVENRVLEQARLDGEIVDLQQQRNAIVAELERAENKPKSDDLPTETERLSAQLEELFQERDQLDLDGRDTQEITSQIIDIKRLIRQGPQLQPGEFLGDGRYRLGSIIGRGGFATVWKAFDRKARKPVALKILHSQFSQDQGKRERFFRGARQMARLEHEAILDVFDPQCSEDDLWFYYVMEYVEGQDLRKAVLANVLTDEQKLSILGQVAGALDHAHSQDVIHRDVKPANILVRDDLRVKLTDFDLVRAMDTTGGTRTNASLGTFLFAAPEQMRAAGEVDQRADVFSFAATMVFVLLEAPLELDFLRDPSRVVDRLEVPKKVQKALLQSLSWNPEDRLGSASELWERLEDQLESPGENKIQSAVERSLGPLQPASDTLASTLETALADQPKLSKAPKKAHAPEPAVESATPSDSKVPVMLLGTKSFKEEPDSLVPKSLETPKTIQKPQASSETSPSIRPEKSRTPPRGRPCLVFLGEPDSGKTSVIARSGLPSGSGNEIPEPPGEIRGCVWWLTQEALIADTSGRLIEGKTWVNERDWRLFVQKLKKTNRRHSVSGVILCIPATSLLEDTTDQRVEKAKALRQQLDNLQQRLGLRFPIFVLITKADRILGFTEFFNKLPPDSHHQIFGWSSPAENERWMPDNLIEIFSEMTSRMRRLRIDFMQETLETQKFDHFFIFPEEFKELEVPLGNYLDILFWTSWRFQEPFVFRGFYFSSSLQEGNPIAVACREFLRGELGDQDQVLTELGPATQLPRPPLFIHDLFCRKLIPEQGLVKRTREAIEQEKRYQNAPKVLMGIAVVTIILGLLPAIGNLPRVLKPVNEVAADAKLCIEAAESTEPCGVDYTYKLIHKIETTRERLGDSRWLMRLLLQGGTKNEITQELLPTLQAGLFRLGVLRQLLESFDARSTPRIWQDGKTDFGLFPRAYLERLRFDEYQRPESRKDNLKEVVTLEPILRFLQKHPGVDPSQDGLEIDRWLADTSTLGDIAEIEKIFQYVLHTEERFDLMTIDRLTEFERARATFDAYWVDKTEADRQYQAILDQLYAP